MEPTLNEIIQWAKEAGQILRDGYGQIHQVTNKSSIDLVTEIDQQSEDFLTERILQKYPAPLHCGGRKWRSERPNSRFDLVY